MALHRAVIAGCGRMGVGRNWPDYPFVYTHYHAYKALSDRVELVGVADPDVHRLGWATMERDTPGFLSVTDAVEVMKADIVSICTQPEQQAEVLASLPSSVKGVFCEKPWSNAAYRRDLKVQVHFWRRFDRTHQIVADLLKGKRSLLTVWAKDEPHTTCHFSDLARWWGSELVYFDNLPEIPQTNCYSVTTGKLTIDFRHGGITEGGFMESALGNLLDAVEGKAELWSPPYVENA